MVEQIVTPRNFVVAFASVDNEFLGVTICSTLSAMCYLYNITLLCCMLNGFRHSKHISKFWYRKHNFVLCRVRVLVFNAIFNNILSIGTPEPLPLSSIFSILQILIVYVDTLMTIQSITSHTVTDLP